MEYPSDVEELFIRLQKEIGGTLKWSDLIGADQEMFTSAVRYVLYICSKRS